MAKNILVQSYKHRGGGGEYIPTTDPDFLARLAADGVGHFRYGEVWQIAGEYARSAEELGDLLLNADALDQLLEHEAKEGTVTIDQLDEISRVLG
jgi:hypothetical protein